MAEEGRITALVGEIANIPTAEARVTGIVGEIANIPAAEARVTGIVGEIAVLVNSYEAAIPYCVVRPVFWGRW